jgi:hypothetical protein
MLKSFLNNNRDLEKSSNRHKATGTRQQAQGNRHKMKNKEAVNFGNA